MCWKSIVARLAILADAGRYDASCTSFGMAKKTLPKAKPIPSLEQARLAELAEG